LLSIRQTPTFLISIVQTPLKHNFVFERADSAGLAWLINAVRDAKQNGVSMSLYKMPEKLRKLAKISDADSFLPVE
jgi:ABC-type transporter Mla MlaB component